MNVCKQRKKNRRGDFLKNDAIITALNELYINRRNQYLKQVNGETYTITAGKSVKSKRGNIFKTRMLVDSMLVQHLRGKVSYGVFSTFETKFILFDFDFENDFNLCKWHYYKVYDALIRAGIRDSQIYTVFSGSKGLHITLYLDKPMKVTDAKRFYSKILESAELSHMTKNIEYRPNPTQGVKLPLGLHYKTKKRVCFVENMNVQQELPAETILTVEKVPLERLYDVIEPLQDEYDNMTDIEVVERAEVELFSRTKLLDIYSLGSDDSFTADYYNDLLTNGLKVKGTRHKVTLQLAMYLKTYYELTENEARERLLKWLNDQDKEKYSTPYKEAVQDTLNVLKYVYENACVLNIAEKELFVTVDELRTVLTAKKADGKHFTPKQKTVLFALLMHGKRYATHNGIFYMTYDQITDITGFSNTKSISELITEFETVGLITIHRRNEAQEGTNRNLPNMYEVLFTQKENATDNSMTSTEIHDVGEVIRVVSFSAETLKALVKKHFETKELRLLLPKRQAVYFLKD